MNNQGLDETIARMIENFDNLEYRNFLLKNLKSICIVTPIPLLKELIKKCISNPEVRSKLDENLVKSLLLSLPFNCELYSLLAEDKIIKKYMFENMFEVAKNYGRFMNEETDKLYENIIQVEGASEYFSRDLIKFSTAFPGKIGNLATYVINNEEIASNFDRQFDTIKMRNGKAFLSMVGTLINDERFQGRCKPYEFWEQLYSKANGEKNNCIVDIFRLLYLSEFSKYIQQDINFLANGGKINCVGNGFFSLTLQMDDKVTKISRIKKKYDIPYHKRILLPQIKKTYEDGLMVECYNLENNDHSQITDEDVLEIFKELEKEGIIWGDAQKENLVRLLRDNKWPEHFLRTTAGVMGFDEKSDIINAKNHEVLKANELAICDLDYLFRFDDPNAICVIRNTLIENYISTSGRYIFYNDAWHPIPSRFKEDFGIDIGEKLVLDENEWTL